MRYLLYTLKLKIREHFCLFHNHFGLVSKKWIVLLLCLFLVGCVTNSEQHLTKVVSVSVDKRKFIIAAPKGFCIDQRKVDKGSESTTVFIVDCVQVQDIGGTSNSRRPLSAVLTATIMGYKNSKIDKIEQLKEFFIQKPGINYLSRSNSNAGLKLHRVENLNSILVLFIEQIPSDINVTQSPFFWRAFLFSKGKIISLTASNFSNNIESRKLLRKLIVEFANNILLANSV